MRRKVKIPVYVGGVTVHGRINGSIRIGVLAISVCAFHCILNRVYVLKRRNTINVARWYNMCMTIQIV